MAKSKVKSEKTVGAIVVSVIALVIAAIIIFASVMSSNGVVTSKGDLMEGVGAKRATRGKLSEEFKELYMDFTIELVSSMASISQENVAFAPSDILASAAFLAGAAEGQTKAEIETVLKIEAQDIGKGVSVLENRASYKEETGGLMNSRSAWFNTMNPFGVKKNFLKKNAKYYGLKMRREDFTSDDIEILTNQLISQDTFGNTFSSFMFQDYDSMNMISAASFASLWKKKGASKVYKDLYSGHISMLECSFFKTIADAYFMGERYDGIMKELEGDFSFVALLPKARGQMYYSVSDMIQELLLNDQFQLLLKNAKKEKVSVALPEFSNSVNAPTTTDFSKALSDMGIKSVFNSQADLSNMAANSNNLYLNNLVAAGDISITQSGACINTDDNPLISEKEFKKCKVSMTFDHTFVYFIYDNKSQLPVYCGILNRIV